MGTDIHPFIEVQTADGKWIAQEPKTKNRWLGEARENESEEDRLYREAGKFELDCQRHYNMFAILADVRNETGFAGMTSGEGVQSISSGRGLPQDCDPRMEAWQEGNHSITHCTLKEIQDFDWFRSAKSAGVVSDLEYCRGKGFGRPENYAGGVFGAAIVYIDPGEMEARLRPLLNPTNRDEMSYGCNPAWCDLYRKLVTERSSPGYVAHPQSICTTFEWEVSYLERAGEILTLIVPELWTASRRHAHSDPERARLIVGFDS